MDIDKVPTMKTTDEQRKQCRIDAEKSFAFAKWDAKFCIDLLDDFAQLQARVETAEAQIKPKCPDCNSVRMSHCSDPENCGGVYWPDHMYRALEARVGELTKLVNEQAEDEGLWFIPKYITEDALQKALRRLHAAIEDKSSEECARATLAAAEGEGVK